MEPNQTRELEQARVESLNVKLAEGIDIYNALRGNSDFERRADFLWRNVFERVYTSEMPRDSRFSIEVTEDIYERLKNSDPQHVEKVEDGKQIKFFLNFDPPLGIPIDDPKNTGRVEMTRTGDDTFGLRRFKNGQYSHVNDVLTFRKILNLQIRQKPSPFVQTLPK